MTKYIAHRGASKKFIENTYYAFKYAYESSFDGCECDIRITKDQAFIVYHDEHLLRLNQVNKSIKSLTLLEILSNQYQDGQRIMTLEYLLHLHANYNKTLLIEVKDALSIDEMTYLYKLLSSINIEKIKIISFHLDVIIFFKQYLSVMYLKDELDEKDIHKLIELDIRTINLNIQYYHQSKHDMYKKYQFDISYWTVDDKRLYPFLEKEEVHFITTNIVK